MNILLISPVPCENVRTKKELMIPQLALYILKGLTPLNHHVQIVEEEVSKIDLNYDCDLVGISCMTANAPRAYELCEEFRNRGKVVILGGVHPTILPNEALKHCNSVVIGEAEGVWKSLLNDFVKGELKSIYHQENPALDEYIPKDFSELLKKRLFNIIPILTSRGCPYNCEFCCVSNLFGERIRHIPIPNIIKDIRSSKAKNFIFLDDNIIGDLAYAKELFKAIKPLRINWVGQASIALLTQNEEILELAAQSGCKSLFIGLESVTEDKMKFLHKSFNEINKLEDALNKISKMGILIHASIVFGFDTDTTEIFSKTTDFLIKNRVSTVSFNVLTPYPGTKVYEEFKKEDRLLTTDWKYYNHNTVVFYPKNMTPYELQYGKTYARKKFYRFNSLVKRFYKNSHNPFVYFLTNYGHRQQVKVELKRITELKYDLFENIPSRIDN